MNTSFFNQNTSVMQVKYTESDLKQAIHKRYSEEEIRDIICSLCSGEEDLKMPKDIDHCAQMMIDAGLVRSPSDMDPVEKLKAVAATPIKKNAYRAKVKAARPTPRPTQTLLPMQTPLPIHRVQFGASQVLIPLTPAHFMVGTTSTTSDPMENSLFGLHGNLDLDLDEENNDDDSSQSSSSWNAPTHSLSPVRGGPLASDNSLNAARLSFLAPQGDDDHSMDAVDQVFGSMMPSPIKWRTRASDDDSESDGMDVEQ